MADFVSRDNYRHRYTLVRTLVKKYCLPIFMEKIGRPTMGNKGFLKINSTNRIYFIIIIVFKHNNKYIFSRQIVTHKEEGIKEEEDLREDLLFITKE